MADEQPPVELSVLTREPHDPRWTELRICPIGYESHSQLPSVLSEWADYVEAGIWGEAQRFGVIVAASPPPVDSDDDYIRGVLEDPHKVGLFTGRAQDARWLKWVADTLHPGLMYRQPGDLTEAQKQLQHWFTRCFATNDHTAQAALGLIGAGGSVMPVGLWRQMMGNLRSCRCGVSPDLKRRLLVAMADAAPAAGSDLLSGVFEDCRTPDDDSLVLELFARLHSPRMRDPEQRNLRVSCLEPVTDMLEGFRHLAGDFMSIADQRLRQDARRDGLFCKPRRRPRRAIEPHPQDDQFSDPDPLLDAARDLLDILIQDQSQAAGAQIRAWETSRWTILQRLALYGHTVRGDITSDERLAVLVECPSLLVDRALHHEAMSLIAAALPGASPSVVDELVATVCANEDSDRIRFNKLGWIARHAPDSQTAQEAFHTERSTHPDWQVGEHADFLGWVEITVTSGLPDDFRADLPNLAALVLNDPVGALDRVLSHYPDSGSDLSPSPMWFDALGAVQAVTDADPRACLLLLEALVSYRSEHMDAVVSVAHTALTSLDRAARQDDALRNNIRRLCVRLWRTVTDRWPPPEPGTPERDWTQAAANSCAGRIARLFFLTVKPNQPHPGGTNSLRASDTLMLRVMLEGNTAASHHAQNVCAQNLWWLHTVGRHGVGRHGVASLDPTTDHERATRYWEGYLYHARWSHEMVEDGLLKHLIAFAPNIDQRGREPREGFAHLTSGLSLYSTAHPLDSDFPWLTRLTSTSEESTRIAFLRALGHELSNLPHQERQQHWDRWVSCYLTSRVHGDPRPLSPGEATESAAVGVQLGNLFPAVVDIVVLTPAPLAPEQMILLLLTDTDLDDGTESSVAKHHPHDTARLLAHMLAPPTQRADLASWELALRDVYSLLDSHGAVTAELKQQMTRMDVQPPTD